MGQAFSRMERFHDAQDLPCQSHPHHELPRSFLFCAYDHELQKDALIRQDLYPLAADALGRVMVCTMLMAGGLKDRETFQLTFSGSGPLGGVVAISDGEGGVRGYVTNGKVSGSTGVGFVSDGGR